MKNKPIEEITCRVLGAGERESRRPLKWKWIKSVNSGALSGGRRPPTDWPRDLGNLKPHQRFSPAFKEAAEESEEILWS